MAGIIPKSRTRKVEDDETSPENLRSLFDKCMKFWLDRLKSNDVMMTGTHSKEPTLEKIL